MISEHNDQVTMLDTFTNNMKSAVRTSIEILSVIPNTFIQMKQKIKVMENL